MTFGDIVDLSFYVVTFFVGRSDKDRSNWNNRGSGYIKKETIKRTPLFLCILLYLNDEGKFCLELAYPKLCKYKTEKTLISHTGI